MPLTLLLALPLAAGLAAPATDAVGPAVRSAVRALVADPHTAGVSLAVLKDGRWATFHFGTVDRARAARPTDSTVYPIASITKTFTGTLLAQAAVEGRLTVDDDVRKYLDGPYPNLEFEGQPIRLHHLLSHRSGLPFLLPEAPMERTNQALAALTRADFYTALRAVRLAAPPGQRFQYSNAGAMLAGYVLERVYGLPYERLLKTKLTGPWHMDDTAITMSPDQRARRAKGYEGQGGEAPSTPDTVQAAAALKSTLADMMKYAAAHLSEKEAAVRLSHAPTLASGAYSVGLNWQMLRAGDRRLIWQQGNIPGFVSYCILLPESGLALVILTNESDENAGSRLEAAANTLLKELDPLAVLLP